MFGLIGLPGAESKNVILKLLFHIFNFYFRSKIRWRRTVVDAPKLPKVEFRQDGNNQLTTTNKEYLYAEHILYGVLHPTFG